MIYPTVQLLLPPQYVIQCLFSSLHSQPRKDFSPSSPCSFPLASSPAMEAFLEFLPFLKNLAICLPFIVVQLLSNVQLFATHGLQHAGLPCPSLSPGVWANSCHWVGDAIQQFHLWCPSSPPALSLSQNQGLSQWVSSSHQVAKVLEL